MTSWSDYALVYGGLILTAVGMGVGTFLIIKFDQPKGPKKKTDG